MASMGTHGQGSIVREAKGTFRVAVTMADGRRVYRRLPDAKSAERIRRELVAMRENDLHPSGQTLADFLRSWLASLRDARRQRIRPRTLDHYTLVVERHIIPALGRHRVGDLSERHVQQWLDQDPGSPRTVHHHRAVLRRALNVAARQRVVGRNVAVGVELPEPGGSIGRPLTLDEARRLVGATGSDRLGPLWRIAIDTGARQAELLGLGWDDLDTEAGTVTIASQLQRLAGGWVRTPTKAARELGVVALSPATVEALRVHRVRMAAERAPGWRYPGLVFPTPKGEPYHQADVLRAFHAACDAAGIAHDSLHG
jgi:integrase